MPKCYRSSDLVLSESHVHFWETGGLRREGGREGVGGLRKGCGHRFFYFNYDMSSFLIKMLIN